MAETIQKSDYKNWIYEIKSKIKNSQIKAALRVNSELIQLYWDIGAMIAEKKKSAKWGSSFIAQTAKDLKAEFPDLSGFSQRNLYSMKQFYLFYNNTNEILHQLGAKLNTPKSEEVKGKQTKPISSVLKENEFFHQLGGKLENEIFHQVGGKLETLLYVPWRHHTLIMQKTKNIEEAMFYVSETIENNWSRSVLEYQIGTNLYKRQGKAISNFKYTLPEQDGDLAQQLLKDPYDFNFIGLGRKAKERDLEDSLVENITQFLLELGKGFAYMGRQFKLKVGSKEYRTDLLFYHTQLKSYIIIELKMKEFEPEFVGKLNFYTTAINEIVKNDDDKPTIGILLCNSKDDLVVDFSLKDINKPIGVSEFSYTELPEEIRSKLPSKQEFLQLLNKK